LYTKYLYSTLFADGQCRSKYVLLLLAGSRPATLPYAVAKRGVEAFTKVQANEEGPTGIRVNAIPPRIGKTDIGGRRAHAPSGIPTHGPKAHLPRSYRGKWEEAFNFISPEKVDLVTLPLNIPGLSVDRGSVRS
jgi:NAD(P)-dependent dehydrogenase (short-subunit alcohol dehydrogenase family)